MAKAKKKKTEPKVVGIKDLSLEKLKAAAYDLLSERSRIDNTLRVVEQELKNKAEKPN